MRERDRDRRRRTSSQTETKTRNIKTNVIEKDDFNTKMFDFWGLFVLFYIYSTAAAGSRVIITATRILVPTCKKHKKTIAFYHTKSVF